MPSSAWKKKKNINITATESITLNSDSGVIADVTPTVIAKAGNINITTSGIFGLEFRDELTEESDITASSQFGVNGTVEINNIGIDPGSGIVSLPAELTDSSQQIAAGCSNNNGSSFVATGRGGIPQNPSEQMHSNRTWSDIRDNNASYHNVNSNVPEVTPISRRSAIIEATGFIRNQNGKIELVALSPRSLSAKQLSECSGLNT